MYVYRIQIAVLLLSALLSWSGPVCAGIITADNFSPLLDVLPRSSADATSTARLNEQLRSGVMAFDREDQDQALRTFEAAAREFPELPPPRLLLARLFLAKGNTAAARALLERSAFDHADYPGVHVTLGRLALAEGRLADAEAQFEKAAIIASQGSTDVHAQYAPVCLDGRAEVAERRGDFRTAASLLAALASLKPEVASVHFRLGCACFRCGQREQATESLSAAVGLDRALPPVELTLAELHMLAGETEEAGRLLESAVQSTPDEPRLQTALSGWLLKQDRAHEARERAATAVSLDPAARDARFVLGLATLHSGGAAEASEIFAVLQQSSPTDLEALRHLALSLAHQDDQESRERALQHAISLARQLPENRLAQATLGWCQYRVGRLAEAKHALLRSIAGGQGPAETGYYLACVLRDLGEATEIPALLESASFASAPFLFQQEVQRWRAASHTDVSAGDSADEPCR